MVGVQVVQVVLVGEVGVQHSVGVAEVGEVLHLLEEVVEEEELPSEEAGPSVLSESSVHLLSVSQPHRLNWSSSKNPTTMTKCIF